MGQGEAAKPDESQSLRIPRRRLLGSGLLATAASAIWGLFGRSGPAGAQEGNFVVLGQDNLEETPTGISNIEGEGAALFARKQSGEVGSIVVLGAPGAGIDFSTTGMPGVTGFAQGGPGAIFSSTIPLTEGLSHTLGVVGIGERGGGFFTQGPVDPAVLPVNPAGVTGFAQGGPGAIFSSTIPLTEGFSHTLGVVGLGERGGGFFFQGPPSGGNYPEPAPGSGVQGISSDPTGAGVVAMNTAADGEALRVAGRATFSRSGTAVVPAGDSTVTVQGVPLTETSFVLATGQGHSNTVRGVALDPSTASFTIRLARPTQTDFPVGWFVVN